MTETQVLEALDRFIANHRNHLAAANALGISKGYLCDIRKQRKPAPDAVLKALGIERLTVYQETTPSNAAGSPAKRTKRGKSTHKPGSTRNTAPRAA